MRPRWVTFAVFAMLVGFGGWWNRPSHVPSTTGWRAARPILANTRITREHLKREKGATPVAAWGGPALEDLLGRYALKDIAAEQFVTAEALGETPAISLSQGTVLLVYSTQNLGAAAILVNARATVYVCDADKQSCPGGPYVVEAVLGKPEGSSALIRAAVADAIELNKIARPQFRIAALP